MSLTKVQEGVTDNTVGRGRVDKTLHNIDADTHYTLTNEQNEGQRLEITDSGVLLTGAINIIVNDEVRNIHVINSTTQILTFKTLSGIGIPVKYGASADLHCNGTTVEYNTSIAQCKAWINLNGTNTISIRDSFNISSIVDNAVGAYTINFTQDMENVNYSVILTCLIGMGRSSQSDTVGIYGSENSVSSGTGVVYTTSAFKIGAQSTGGGDEDNFIITAQIFSN